MRLLGVGGAATGSMLDGADNNSNPHPGVIESTSRWDARGESLRRGPRGTLI
jgi:hypothetical protein